VSHVFTLKFWLFSSKKSLFLCIFADKTKDIQGFLPQNTKTNLKRILHYFFTVELAANREVLCLK